VSKSRGAAISAGVSYPGASGGPGFDTRLGDRFS
jgi:hypothetical protein